MEQLKLFEDVSDDEMLFYLMDLKSKFSKISTKDYVLAYSGGKDSHRLMYLIKNVFEIQDIKNVGINTYMEHSQILQRMKDNCDVILTPELKPSEIKEKYGSPCFSKIKDEYISRYQKGLRSENCMNVIDGKNVWFNLNKNERKLLYEGKLHKISNKCCDCLKKKPMKKYQKESGKNVIIGIIKGESKTRDSAYKSCFTKDMKFVPMFDCTDQMAKKIDKYYNIEIPEIYNYIDRTGCMGCPYGRRIQLELSLIENPNQLKFIKDYHKESYKIKGIK